jgi:hypothetical protein
MVALTATGPDLEDAYRATGALKGVSDAMLAALEKLGGVLVVAMATDEGPLRVTDRARSWVALKAPTADARIARAGAIDRAEQKV